MKQSIGYITVVVRDYDEAMGHYNYCLLNRYRSGADSVGMHADDEPGISNVIGSLSLGTTRTFRIRHNKPAKDIPLKDGYFEMTLPKAFFEGNPNSITVNWIDFYRN